MHRQPPADSNRPNFQDLHGWRQGQLQSGLLSPAVNTCYITVDIAEGNTKLKLDQVSVLVQCELSEKMQANSWLGSGIQNIPVLPHPLQDELWACHCVMS